MWEVKTKGIGEGRGSTQTCDSLIPSRIVPVFHPLYHLYSNNKHLMNANILPWLPESWQPYTSLLLWWTHSFPPSIQERKIVGGKTKGLRRHPLINMFKSWHVFFLWAPLNWHPLSMALFTLKWFAIVLHPLLSRPPDRWPIKCFALCLPASLPSPSLFFLKTQSAHPLALPPPGVAVGKPGALPNSSCSTERVWIPVKGGKGAHQSVDSVSNTVRDKWFWVPETVIEKKKGGWGGTF